MPHLPDPRAAIGRFTGLVALAILVSSCVAAAGGDEPPSSRAPRTTTTTTMLPAATPTDLMDPNAPGLGNGGYDAQHYHVDLAFVAGPPAGLDEGADYDPADAEIRIEATTTIDVTATVPLEQIAFDFTGSTVSAVTVDGEPAGFDREPSELIVTLPRPAAAGETRSIAVTYGGVPGAIDSRVARVKVGWMGAPDGTWHVRNDPDGAHRWFPANDHPSDKATFLFDVRVPIGYVAAASGRFERTYSGIESSSFRWSADTPIPPSSATVILGELVLVPDRQTSTAMGIEVRHLLPPDLAEDPPGALANIADMIGFFEERFGPYPYEAFGVAVVDDENVGLGANTWAILTRAQLEANDAELAIAARLARHWFGDSLTPATWSDVWLSTTFVRYAEWLWIERDLGERYGDAVASKARSNVESAGWPPPTEPRIGDAYVGSVFIHGAVTLHAVRLRMGDATFFDLLAKFYDAHAGGTASTSDLDELVLREGGSDVRYLYDTWLTADELPGFPDR